MQYPALGVFLQVHLQGLHHRRGHPAGTDLVTGKFLLVHDQDIQAGVTQGPGQGGAGGTAADNEDITLLCHLSPYLYRWARVHGTSLFCWRLNTTWNSCSSPVVKAAMEPDR